MSHKIVEQAKLKLHKLSNSFPVSTHISLMMLSAEGMLQVKMMSVVLMGHLRLTS